MKLLATLAFAFSATFMVAQNAIDSHFQAYKSDSHFSQVSISAKMFELFTHIEGDTPEEQEVLQAISKLKGLKMLVGSNIKDNVAEYNKAVSLPSAEYEELMVFSQDGEEFTFKIREKDGVIVELLMIGYGPGEFYILSLFGEIDLKQVRRLARVLEIDGMQHLEKVDAK